MQSRREGKKKRESSAVAMATTSIEQSICEVFPPLKIDGDFRWRPAELLWAVHSFCDYSVSSLSLLDFFPPFRPSVFFHYSVTHQSAIAQSLWTGYKTVAVLSMRQTDSLEVLSFKMYRYID